MRHTKILIYRNPQFSKCPQCNALGTLHRSRARNMYEQIVRRITVFKTYRCRECGWRGFRSTIVVTRKSVKAILIYLILILITAYIVDYFLLRFVV